MASLHWLDYVIFVSVLLVSLCIGLYHGCAGGRQKTTTEFLLANRSLKVIPTLISMLVSFQSAIMILGFVSEMYTYGFGLWPGYVVSLSLSMVIVERLFVPWFYPLKLTSVFEVNTWSIYHHLYLDMCCIEVELIIIVQYMYPCMIIIFIS